MRVCVCVCVCVCVSEYIKLCVYSFVIRHELSVIGLLLIISADVNSLLFLFISSLILSEPIFNISNLLLATVL